jgi:hypothetical protein
LFQLLFVIHLTGILCHDKEISPIREAVIANPLRTANGSFGGASTNLLIYHPRHGSPVS